MLFSELLSQEYADFATKYPKVVGLATAFGTQLELDCPDWLRPVDGRGSLEVFEKVGAVIARGVLSVDLVGKLYEEQVRNGVYMVQSENGHWFYFNHMTERPPELTNETRLAKVYKAATGCSADLLMNRYEFREGINGFQYPHRDRGLLKPSIAFGKGPGATRIIGDCYEVQIPRSSEGARQLDDLKIAGQAIDLDTDIYDITVFDGLLYTHHGLRIPPEVETEEPRLSVLLNSISYIN